MKKNVRKYKIPVAGIKEETLCKIMKQGNITNQFMQIFGNLS